MIKSPVEFFRTLPKKVCPECGQTVKEQAESYLMECDRCLSKKNGIAQSAEGFRPSAFLFTAIWPLTRKLRML